MGVDDWEQRLSRISTKWTLMFQAHQAGDHETAARAEIIERYTGAVYRYLLGAVGDAHAAEELAQEFALRFLRGDFHRARPERGRFRNYLKSALVNLVNDHHRKRQAAPGPLPADTPDRMDAASDAEANFAASWREEVLERTWQTLAEANPTYHAVLLLHVQRPDLASPQMADVIAAEVGKPMNAPLVRKTLQRAQEKFAKLLVDEVNTTLEMPLEDDLRLELEELDLLRYCRSVLKRRAAGESEA
jgi:RNA polymerase sigma factor (sigma-70 family)